MRPSVEYSDDDDNGNSDSDHENDSLEYQPKDRYESLQSEVVINYYKQQLSPILEESEDETCKTFVMNETKCLDSTRLVLDCFFFHQHLENLTTMTLIIHFNYQYRLHRNK